MRNLRILFLLCVATILSSFEAISQEQKNNRLFFDLDQKKSAQLTQYAEIIIDRDQLLHIFKQRQGQITLDLPKPSGEIIQVELEQFEVFTETAEIFTTKEKVNYSGGIHYRGKTVKGKGLVTLSVFQDHIAGLVSLPNEGNINYVKSKENNSKYFIYSDQAIIDKPSHECSVKDHPDVHSNTSPTRILNEYTVSSHIETDYALFLDKGSVVGVLDYITSLWAMVATIYDQEDITVLISNAIVWTEQDPYDQSDLDKALESFETTRTTYVGDVAHLIGLAGDRIGGIAYIDGLCSPYTYAYSNISEDYLPMPNYSWTVNVVTHEMGHVLGSPHTHDCSWDGGPLDNCFNPEPEGNCSMGPEPPNGGTIMSYCHLTDMGIDFNNGFGSQPGDLIRQRIGESNCLIQPVVGEAPEAKILIYVYDACASAEVQFVSDTQGPDLNYLWHFPGANTEESTEQYPLIQYDSAGYYAVTLIVSNFFGTDTLTLTKAVEIIDTPEAEIGFEQNYTEFEFIVESPTPDSLIWHLGDGTTTDKLDFQHQYLEQGSYEVSLETFYDCGSTIETQIVHAYLEPTAGYADFNTKWCPFDQLSIVNQSSENITDYLWTLSGPVDLVSQEESPVFEFVTPGEYTFSVIVSNPLFADTIIQNDKIEVRPETAANFGYDANLLDVTFENLSENGNTYLWEFGDGASTTSANTSYTFPSFGTYEVSLTSYSNCNVDQIVKTVEVNQLPVAQFDITDNSFCLGTEVQLLNTSSSNAQSIEWILPGSDIENSTSNNPTVIYDQPGLYPVTLIAKNDIGNDTTTIENYIEVLDVPELNFEVTRVDDLQFIFEDISAYGKNYFWEFGDGTSSTNGLTQHVFPGEGFYDLTLTVSNECGAVDTTINFEVFTIPIPLFEQPSEEFCIPATVQLYSAASDNTFTHEWIVSNNTISESSTEKDPSFEFPVLGFYDITYIVGNPEGYDTLTVQDAFEVVKVPQAGFSLDINGTQISSQVDIPYADLIEWNISDGNTYYGNNFNHNFTQESTYSVEQIVRNFCGSDTVQYTYDIFNSPVANFSASTQKICPGELISFSNQSSNNYTQIEWHFEGTNQLVSNQTNPEVQYNNPGFYDVELIVSNPSGQDTLVIENYIEVINETEASFQFLQNGLTIEFINTSEYFNDISWDFGDGNMSTELSPTHTFPAFGTYTIRLVTQNECGEKIYAANINVSQRPTALFTSSNQILCGPAEIQFFNGSSIDAFNIEWTFEGGFPNTSTEPNPIIQYETPGLYDVRLFVESLTGKDTLYMTEFIEIEDSPNAQFVYTVQGNTVHVEDRSDHANYYQYLWPFASSTDAEPSFTALENGSFSLIQNINNTCGDDSYSIDITIDAYPEASFLAFTEMCEGDVQTFSNESRNGQEVSWIVPGAIILEESYDQITVQYMEQGQYDVGIVVSNQYGSDSLISENIIIVRPQPQAFYEYLLDGNLLQISNQSTHGTNFYWDFGDGNTSEEYDPLSYKYTEDGIYTLSLTVENACGSMTYEQNLSVEIIEPIIRFDVQEREKCIPATLSLTDESENNPTAYSWLLKGPTEYMSNDPNPSFEINQAGVYDLIIYVENQYGNSGLEFKDFIEVFEGPVLNSIDYTLSNNTIEVSNAPIDDSSNIVWNFGDGTQSLEWDANHIYAFADIYELQMIYENQCGKDSLSEKIDVKIPNPDSEDSLVDMLIIPNPTFGNAELSINGFIEGDFNIDIFNPLGQMVYSRVASSHAGLKRYPLPTEHLTQGHYYVRVTRDDFSEIRKFFKN